MDISKLFDPENKANIEELKKLDKEEIIKMAVVTVEDIGHGISFLIKAIAQYFKLDEKEVRELAQVAMVQVLKKRKAGREHGLREGCTCGMCVEGAEEDDEEDEEDEPRPAAKRRREPEADDWSSFS